MSNPHKRELQVILGKKTYTMKPTLEAVVQLEDELGRGLLDVLSTMGAARRDGALGALKVKEIASVLRWGVWGGTGVMLEPEDALFGVWAYREQGKLPYICGLAMGFISLALNVDDPQIAEEQGTKK